jgi:hypothetical protein
VPANPQGARVIPLEPQLISMYANYQSLHADLASRMHWDGHALSVGEDISYGNMVACPSAKWINRLDQHNPTMPPMSAGEQRGIVAECFHHRRYFLRQLFQSQPAVLMVFSQSTTDAFIAEMTDHFTVGAPQVGDKIDTLLHREVRLRFGVHADGTPAEARVIFAPHITGDAHHFDAARALVLEQLVAEAQAGRITFNPATGHLARGIGDCFFCPMLGIGACDYAAEITPRPHAPASATAEVSGNAAAERRATEAMLEAFLGQRGPRGVMPAERQRICAAQSAAQTGWALSGDPARDPSQPVP